MNNFKIKMRKIVLIFMMLIAVLSSVSFADEVKNVTNPEETIETKQIIEGACYFLSVAIILSILKITSYMEAFPKIKEKISYDYFKDITTVADSPFQVNKLLYDGLNKKDGVLATIFYLCKKGWLEFEILGKKDKDIYIILKESKKEISEEAKLLYEYMLQIKPEEKRFSIKEFKKYGIEHLTKFLKTVDLMLRRVKKLNEAKGYEDTERTEASVITILLAFCMAIFTSGILVYHIFEKIGVIPVTILMTTYTIMLIVAIKACIQIGFKSEKGARAYDDWNAMRKFLANFHKTEITKMPDLKFLEEYIIYSMAIGSHTGSIKGFEQKMPELTNGTLNSDKYSFTFLDKLYVDGYKTSFVWEIDSAIQELYAYSSD